MSNIKQLDFLKRLAKGIASLFGNNCEVTVHDPKKGYEKSIIAIENGHVTGRHVGDGSSEVVLRVLKERDHTKVEDEYNYLARTKSGRILKSSTIYVRDRKDNIISVFGINYDLTDLVMAKNAIEAATNTTETKNKSAAITASVNELLDQLIAEADEYVGKPIAMMTKDDKVKAIQFLNDKGAFLIKKAGDKVARHYDISKYTLYNYMGSED